MTISIGITWLICSCFQIVEQHSQYEHTKLGRLLDDFSGFRFALVALIGTLGQLPMAYLVLPAMLATSFIFFVFKMQDALEKQTYTKTT